MACCPCHDDKTPSLSIKEIDNKVLLKCFAGCEYKDLAKALNISYSNDKESFDALEYISEKKNIPISYLESLGIVSNKNELIIPYKYVNQKYARSRIRNCSTNSFYWEKDKDIIISYGIWRKQKDYCIIVEGESDCWTLWYSGFNAIGIPGSTMYKKLSLDHIKQFDILYIVREEDQAGNIFIFQMKKYLISLKYQGNVHVLDLGYKDISEMYIDGDNFKEEINFILSQARNKKSNLQSIIEDNPFPTFIFPSPFKEFIEDCSKSFGCDEAFVATPMLSLLSSVVGGNKRIMFNNTWKESASLYLALVAEPGSMKTPIANFIKQFMLNIINYLELENDREDERYEQEQIEYKIDKEVYTIEKKKGNILPIPSKPKQPIMYDFFLEDITVEALAERLNSNPKGIFLFKDELVSWITSMNQYKGGLGSDKQFYLSAWSNSFASVARKGKRTKNTKKPYLSVYGAIPPEQLHLFTKQENDGFVDRLLFSYPKPFMKKFNQNQISNSLITSIEKEITDFFHDDIEEMITVSSEGIEYLQEWCDKLFEEAFLCENQMKGFLNKYHGQAGSIILILAYINGRKEANVSDVAHAILAIEYFRKCTEKIFKKEKLSKEDKIIQKVIEYCKNKNKTSISTRDIYTYKIGKIMTAQKAKDILKKMQELKFGILNKNKFKIDNSIIQQFSAK